MTENELKRCRKAFHKLLGKNGWGCEDVAFGIFQAGYTHQSALLDKAVEALGRIAATENLTWAEKEKLPFNWAIAKTALAEITKGD